MPGRFVRSFGIDELAAKLVAEFFGVLSLGKAEDDHVEVA
jgi:hypothetical protein